jgi:hypothetical protein
LLFSSKINKIASNVTDMLEKSLSFRRKLFTHVEVACVHEFFIVVAGRCVVKELKIDLECSAIKQSHY